jgi:hypothetical protein
VNVRAYFVGGTSRQDVVDGSAVLSITDLGTGEEAAHWLAAVFTGGRCAGFRLRKLGGAGAYELPRDLSSCSCPDRAHRPGRPGGCRHMAALRQALPAVGRPAPAGVPVAASAASSEAPGPAGGAGPAGQSGAAAEPHRTAEGDVKPIAGHFGIDPARPRRAVEEAG